MATISKSQLKYSIKKEAKSLGFDLVGVTTPNAPAHLDVYQSWIAAARHGQMGYLATQRNMERRSNPRKILPECKSVLVLGMNYLPAEAVDGKSPAQYKIASYALGDDYHDLIPDRLQQLVRRMEEWLGSTFPYLIYTDTGPILERELAQRAGLGWIGKNTCLINPQMGSYFFLAEVLLGVDLPPDAPHRTDHCGSCNRCVEACPTQCILEDRTIDARRCISYLTIELKGAIPVDLRPLMDGWLFGCDVCQQVCPWNLRFAQPTRENAFKPRNFLAEPQAGSLLTLELADYQSILRGSPLKRTKRSGLARNAAVAAGTLQDKAALESLKHSLLSDEDKLVRGHAAWALGQFEAPDAEENLRRALESETSDWVRRQIQQALAGPE